MRYRKIATAGATRLRPLMLFGLLLTSCPFAEAQSPSNAGDSPRVPTGVVPPGQGANAANAAANPGAAPGSRLLIAHGLEMAIEGSTLQGLAMNPNTPTGGPASPIGGPGSPTGGPTTGAAGTPGVNSSGLGFTGSPGETVSGRPVSTPATGTGSARPGGDPTRTAEPGTLRGPATGGTSPATPTPAPAITSMGGSPASILQQEAMRSFQAGNDLLGQANPAPGPEQNFHQAALIYAATLKSLGAQPTAPVAAGTARPAGLPESRPVGALAAATVGANELASIALINHGVKGAIGSLRIKQMVGPMGSSGSPAAQQLLAHARQMDAGSRSTIQAINGGAAGVVGPGGVVQTLAQQADQLIMAMQALHGEPGAPGR